MFKINIINIITNLYGDWGLGPIPIPQLLIVEKNIKHN